MKVSSDKLAWFDGLYLRWRDDLIEALYRRALNTYITARLPEKEKAALLRAPEPKKPWYWCGLGGIIDLLGPKLPEAVVDQLAASVVVPPADGHPTPVTAEPLRPVLEGSGAPKSRPN